MKTPLLILGSGSFAVETLDIAEAAGSFAPLGFVNSVARPESPTVHSGLPVYWIDDVPYRPDECWVVAGIVSTRRRQFIETMAARGYRFISLVHPAAVVSRRATVGAGCVLHAAVVVSSNTYLSDHVILNRGCLIGHDNRIGAFTTIGPGANLAGGVEVGSGAFVGAGAVVRDHLTLGSHSVVGAGAVVVKAVPANVVVMGVPAQVTKRDIEGL